MVNALSIRVGDNGYAVFNESRNEFPQDFGYAAVFRGLAVERFVSRRLKPHCQKLGFGFGRHNYFR